MLDGSARGEHSVTQEPVRRGVTVLLVVLLLVLGLQTVLGASDLDPVIAGPTEVVVGERATFSAGASGGSIANHSWDFRDGSLAYGPVVEHAFAIPGTYLIGLVVLGTGGHEALATRLVTVVNDPPVAVAGPDRTVEEDEELLLDASASTDSLPDREGLTYRWELGDGRAAEGERIQVAYPHAGTYRVRLRVTDPHAAFGLDDLTITVTNRPPTAAAGPDRTVYEDEPLLLDATGSADTPSDLPHLTYLWELEGGPLLTGPRAVHGYPRAGTYGVTLTVTDDDGARSVDRLTVTVVNRPPGALLSAPAEVPQGATVHLQGEATDDPTDLPLLSFRWNDRVGGWERAFHATAAGDRAVALLVTDDNGAGARVETVVRVVNVAPHVALSDAYAWVDVTAHLAGEPGNAALLEVLRGAEVADAVLLERRQGPPSQESRDLPALRLRLDDLWRLRATYRPASGAAGSNPLAVTLRFEDGREATLRHAFEPDDPTTWTWTETINRFLGGVPLHLGATVFDPGPEGLQVLWSFDGRPEDAHSLPESPEGFQDQEVETVRTLRLPRRGEASLAVRVVAVDGLGATAGDEAVLRWDGTALRAEGLSPRVEALPAVATHQDGFVLPVATVVARSGAPVAVTWDLGDGTATTGPAAAHAYLRPGTYLARVRAEVEGQATMRGFRVEVADVGPVPRFLVVGEPVQDRLLRLDATPTIAPRYDLPLLRYHWDLGDGTEAVGQRVAHAYREAGTYRIALTVVDPQGSRSTVEGWVEVSNPPPQFLATAPVVARQDETVRLPAPVTDTVSDLPRLRYRWHLEDGVREGRAVSLSFPRPGEHDVSLEVSDGEATVQTVVRLIVGNVPPFAHAPSAIHYGPVQGLLHAAVGGDGPSDAGRLTFRWAFGDGSDGTGTPVTHRYPSTGRYDGTLTVEDPWGGRASVPFSVHVTYDGDGDGLSREAEEALGTDDGKADTDGDGLLDATEALGLRGYMTDPTLPDTDGDGLWDGHNLTTAGALRVGELSVGTDPLNPDTDGDGLADGDEVAGWEVKTTTRGVTETYRVTSDPLHPDPDEDGLTDDQEALLGTDPWRWDTDDDGLWDDEDPDPLDDDTDGDGLVDGLDRAPDGTASLGFRTRFAPGLVRFRQPFSVFSVEGLYAWVNQYNHLFDVCQFVSTETEAATRTSVVTETTVLDEVRRTFQEGGETNYTPTRAGFLFEQTASFLHFTYGGCDFWSPKQYRIGYAVTEDRWAVDFTNVKEVEVPDGFGGVYQYARERIPVRPGHPVSLVLQYAIPAADDLTRQEDNATFRVGAFGYSVFATDAATGPALYSNIGVGAGPAEGAYQAELRIPGSVTAEAPEGADGQAFLELVVTPFWLDVRPFAVQRRAWDVSSVRWASLSLEVPLFVHQVIARLSVDLEDLEARLPPDLESLASGFHTFGPYRVYLHRVQAGALDATVLGQADAVVLLGISEAEVLGVKDAIDWGGPGTWYQEAEDAFNAQIRWFPMASRTGKLSVHFAEFKDVQQLLLTGELELPELPATPAERDVVNRVQKVRIDGKVVFIQTRWTSVDDILTVGGVRRIVEVRKPIHVGQYERLEDVPALQGNRYPVLRGAIRGAAIGAILVTWGRTGVLAFAEGDVVTGSVFTAATSASVLGTLLADFQLASLGVRGGLSRVVLGNAAIAAVGTIFAAHSLYLASQTSDRITRLSHLEQASAWGIDTAIMLTSPYGTIVVLSWGLTIGIMAVIMPNSVAASVTSSPGTLVTFALEYLFGGGIPSAISQDAFDKSASSAISQMRLWNSVFHIPSIVVLPES